MVVLITLFIDFCYQIELFYVYTLYFSICNDIYGNLWYKKPIKYELDYREK